MATRKLSPIYPGEILAADFLEHLGLSQYRLAHDIMRAVPSDQRNRPWHSGDQRRHRVPPARYFGTSDRFWLNLQARYDLEVERDHLGTRLKKEVRVLNRAS